MSEVKFKFTMKQEIKIAVSGEVGTIIGMACYATHRDHQYYIRYKAAGGRAIESWWSGSALKAMPAPKVPAKKIAVTKPDTTKAAPKKTWKKKAMKLKL